MSYALMLTITEPLKGRGDVINDDNAFAFTITFACQSLFL